MTDAELDLIAEAGATVVHCPTSNLYLASGAAPVRKMLDRGIAVALGTDGSASNTSQDLLECAKIGALVGQARRARRPRDGRGGCDPDDDDGRGAAVGRDRTSSNPEG